MDSIIVTFTYQVCTCIERLMGKLMGISLILHFYLYTWTHLELKQKPKHLQCNLTMPNLINEITLTCLSAENQMLLYHSLLLLHWCFLRQRCNITHTGTKRDKGRLRHEAGKTKKKQTAVNVLKVVSTFNFGGHVWFCFGLHGRGLLLHTHEQTLYNGWTQVTQTWFVQKIQALQGSLTKDV